ncbi:MAG: sulfatase [Acidobacteriota bacterium]
MSVAALFALMFAFFAAKQADDYFNVIFILVDDMGYGNIGAYGNSYHETPNIDRLAAMGMRFTNAYAAAPNCSPTRASLLTGKWPARLHLTQYLPGNSERLRYTKLIQPDLPEGLPLEEMTIAEILGALGYATASIGKWHLGGGRFLPEHHGFDLNFGGGPQGHHSSMFAPYEVPDISDAAPGEYLTDRLTREAERFMEANRERPFFLYLPLYAVHSPIQGKEDLIEKYEAESNPGPNSDPVYAAMVEGVDQSVGRILIKLRELEIDDRTVLFFFSDNGGVRRLGASNGPLRQGKSWLYEGGIREPLIIYWPGVTPTGGVSHTPVSSVDFYSTILEIVGVSGTVFGRSDGLSLVPPLRGGGSLERRTLYWHYPHYSNAGSPPCGAIREGDYKLIEFFEDGNVELYNLAEDMGETRNLF